MIHSRTMSIRPDLVVSLIIFTLQSMVLRYNCVDKKFCKYTFLHNCQLTINGYNQKVPVLLDTIIERMIHLKIDLQRFEILKTKVS
jgi:secreted Zn-dependent insulinase-like peptidase